MVKEALTVEQTIEPTHVAGFNQFVDDFNGARAIRYGAAIDLEMTTNLLVGLQGLKYDVEVPIFGEEITFDHRWEKHHLAYLYWTPHQDWAVSTTYRLDEIKATNSDPEKLSTHQIPLSVSYFNSQGGFGKIETIYLRQKIDFFDPAEFSQGKQKALLLNLSIGWRLPKRTGILSLR